MKHSLPLGAVLLLTATASAEAIELANDGWTPGASAGFQSGFVAGEIGAASLSGGCSAPTLQSVSLLFGGSSASRTITLRLYDDSAGQTIPGAPLYTADFVLTGNDTTLAQINLGAQAIVLPPRFRVGIEFTQAGLPSIARDADGTINPTRNFVAINVGGQQTWFPSQQLGLTGDWIIRADVTCPPLIFANGFE